MNKIMFALVITAVSLVGCARGPAYTTVQTANDKFVLTGADPNVLQANALVACQGIKYEEYSVMMADKGVLSVRCEHPPKTFFQSATETVQEVKKRYHEMTSDTNK